MSMPTATEQLEHLRLAARLAGTEADDLSLPADRDAVLGGIRLHYLDWGGNGPPMLFLHGGCLTAHTWDLVCLALRDEHRCVALDQRGHGDSEWPASGDYGPDAQARDVERLITHLNLEDPILVGQSMGGLNALTCAARDKAAISALVLVDVGPHVSEAGVQRIRDFVLGPAELDSVEDFVERARSFNPARDPRLLRISLRHNLRQLPQGGWTWKYDRRFLEPERFAEIRRRVGDMRDLAGRVQCPTLVVRGANSDVHSEREAERFARDFADGAWVTVPDAGHTVQGDNPAGLVRALRAYLERRNGTDAVPSIRRSGSR
jgi:esterase